jgi:hypothetical protein
MKRLSAVSIRAAGMFVIRQPVARAQLRSELARRRPFRTETVICQGGEFARLMLLALFAHSPARPGVVRFASVRSRVARVEPRLPMSFPSRGLWLLQLQARDGRFVVGRNRRHRKTISCFGMMDRLCGVPLTTRNWSMMPAIAKVLDPVVRAVADGLPEP